MWLNEWQYLYAAGLSVGQSGDSAVLGVTWLVPHAADAVLAHVLCTPYNHAPVYSVALFRATYIYICKVHQCLAIICLLHFWWHDRDFSCAAVVNMGVEQIPKQHRKLTPEKIIPLLLQGLKPATFRSWAQLSAIPTCIHFYSALFFPVSGSAEGFVLNTFGCLKILNVLHVKCW